jgi:hypothetical protein
VSMIVLHMVFDGAFGLAESSPIEKTQTQVHSAGVPCVNFVAPHKNLCTYRHQGTV